CFDGDLNLGGNDTIRAGVASYDIILCGVGDDAITSGANRELVLGDNARLTSGPETATIPATIYSVHEFAISVIETVGFDGANSGNDTIYGSPFNDILFGGGGDDIIYGFEGNDIIFGDQGRVSTANGIPFDPDHPLNGVAVGLGGALNFVATNTTVSTGAGNDLIYAG